jgi:hypothetical protein
VERVVLNALADECGCAAEYLRLGRMFAIVFGESDPPVTKVERVFRNALGNSLIGLSAPRTRQK